MNGLNEVIDLVNDQNDLPVVITEENVEISLPREVLPFSVSGQGDRNTGVKFTGIPNKGYFGQTEVYYLRGDLNTLFAGVQPEIRSREFSVEGVLATINNRYGLKLESTDLLSYEIPDLSAAELETVHPIEFSVIDNSYRWLGTVRVDLLYGNPRIEPLIFVQLLPMLAHPDDPELLIGRYSGQMSTWGFDFTAWKDQLQIDPDTGEWADFATVQEIGKRAGISYWYNGPVVDMPTEAVPGANPDFQRVMVQQSTKGTVKGPLYFHYDVTW